MIVKRISATLALAVLAAAPAAAAVPNTWTAASLMKRIEGRNAGLKSFAAPIHIDGHVHVLFNIPKHLDGTWYFKRPDKSDVVLTDPPSYLKGIKSFIGDILDPAAWRLDSNIAFAGTRTSHGKSLLALRMTKKIYSDQIADTVAYVDPQTFQVVREDFHYRDGSTSVMTLTYRNEDGFSVPAALHGEIHHRMTAVLDATLGKYQMNVPVSDSVFGRH